MEDTTMRKMMFAASLWALSACGNVHEVCNAASDCGDGAACDLVNNECVTGALTVDPTGFAVDGDRWWTITSEPMLAGTFDGSASSIVTVIVGGVEVPATLDGARWSAKLPASSIAPTDTQVTIRLSDAMSRIELAQVLALDNAGPTIALGASRMRDERGDTIDFSTGEPVHTHAGPEIDLAGTECPAIYKYGYLTDKNEATFGRQASPNPLAWTFDIADARVEAAAYRVRTPNNQVLLDWTPMAPGANTVELHRDDFTAFATYEGPLYLDVRARDWAGLETSASTCWEQHWLAAPLQIDAFGPAVGSGSLLAMNLPANSPISWLLWERGWSQLAVQRIVQYTTEPIVIEMKIPDPATGTFSKAVVSGYIEAGTGAGTLCGSAGCADAAPAAATYSESTGAISGLSRQLAVIDEAGSDVPIFDSRVVIPGRAASEPPRAYSIVVYVSSIPELRPSNASYFAEMTLLGLTYTGTMGTTLNVCNGYFEKCTQYGCYEMCSGVTKYTPIAALDKARIDLAPFTVDVRTSPRSGAPAVTPGYVPSSAFVVPAITWDAGDDDLPGPY